MPGCSDPGSASGAEEAHEIVTLGQFLHLLVVDPHQRANLLAENGSRQRPEQPSTATYSRTSPSELGIRSA